VNWLADDPEDAAAAADTVVNAADRGAHPDSDKANVPLYLDRARAARASLDRYKADLIYCLVSRQSARDQHGG
jgi:hypothetical protein